MSNQFNRKHTNENLNFNLILGIGQECSAILNLIEKYLSSTTSPYLSPNTLLSINGDSTILSTNIIDFQARYNDIMVSRAFSSVEACLRMANSSFSDLCCPLLMAIPWVS